MKYSTLAGYGLTFLLATPAGNAAPDHVIKPIYPLEAQTILNSANKHCQTQVMAMYERGKVKSSEISEYMSICKALKIWEMTRDQNGEPHIRKHLDKQA